jgi:drug/metabolite transporter (DMT)-like permease
VSVVLAVLAALANAASSVLQRKANRDTEGDESFRLRLLIDLLRRPAWFWGLLAVVVGFLLQAAALSTGGLAVVQPLLALELPITLFLATRVFRRRLAARDWSAAIGMTGGLVLLLVCLAPGTGSPGDTSNLTWGVGLAITLAVVVGLVGAAARARKARRSALLGIATGAAFGLTAALMAGATHQPGIVATLTAWQTYAMIVVGFLAMLLLQNAFQAGSLINAQPGVTLCDPVVAILWGILALGEPVNSGWWLVGTVSGGVLMAGSALLLARSPAVHAGTPGAPDSGAGDRQLARATAR